MKNDARVRYTKYILKRSLLELMESEAINRITVKEVCELSGLNRATFYTHYKDCFDLLEQIENEMLAEFDDSLRLLRSFDSTELIRAIYDMIEKNGDLFRVTVFSNTNTALIGKMLKMARERSIDYWRASLKISESELDMLFTCMANGFLNVVIDSFGKYSRDEVTGFVNTLLQSVVNAYM